MEGFGPMNHGIVTEEVAETFLALAERCEAAGDLTCPLCGEGDFDIPGISNHWFKWCEVESAIGTARDNAEVAAALRARARQAGEVAA